MVQQLMPLSYGWKKEVLTLKVDHLNHKKIVTIVTQIGHFSKTFFHFFREIVLNSYLFLVTWVTILPLSHLFSIYLTFVLEKNI